jgi:hypothetical protein
MSTRPPTSPGLRRSLAWDLDQLAEAELRRRYAEMADFAEGLLEMGVPVPACWYYHRHLVHRFAAVMAWHERAYRTSSESRNPETGETRVTPGAHAREAAEWWASSWGLAGLVTAWGELECVRRGEGRSHTVDKRQVSTPALEDVVEAHVASLRSRR